MIALAVLFLVAVVVILTLLGRRAWRAMDGPDVGVRVFAEDHTDEDCWAGCVVAYAGKRYDDVCDKHFDAIGAQLLEEAS